MALRIPGFGERFATALAELMAREGLRSQSDAAARLRTRQQNISNWKRGTIPDFGNLEIIANAFGVPWQWLLVGDDGVDALVAWDKKGRPIAPRPPIEEKKQPEQPRAAGDLRSARRAAGGGRS